MRFASPDLQTILDSVRAVHDNFAFEENVGSDRQAEFERLAVPSSDLRARMQKYFERSVQGGRRGHLPSTFSPINHNDLKTIRNAHLTAVRGRGHRADFGAEMP
jgi:hypothetical protein